MPRISKTRTPIAVRASAAAGAGTAQTPGFPTGADDTLAIFLDTTAVTGAGATLTPTVEWSNDNATWFIADPADTFTAITAVGKVVKRFLTKGQYARINFSVTGTTPSITFAVTALIGD